MTTGQIKQTLLAGVRPALGVGQSLAPGKSGTGARRVAAGIAACAIAALAATPVRADDMSELKAEIRALNKRLSDMEKAKAKADAERAKQVEQEKAYASAAPAAGPVVTKTGLRNPFDDLLAGRPVHIY